MKEKTKYIFLDVGDTLLKLYKPPGEIYFEVLNQYGILPNKIEYQDLKKHFSDSWMEISKNVSPEYKDRFSIHKNGNDGWWIDLIDTFLKKIHIDQKIPKVVYDEIFRKFDDPGIWLIEPTFYELLEFAKKNMIGLGIISNWDKRLRPLLVSKGLAEYFDPILVSAEFGYEKPSPKIFEEAIRLTSCKGFEIVYVGDKIDLDYYPPLKLGWDVFLITNKKLDKEIKTIQYLKEIIKFCEI